MVYKLIRLKEVLNQRGVSKSTHYLDIKQGLFTRPVLLGKRSTGWPQSEVSALNKARILGQSNDKIRELVKRLMADRMRVK